MENPPVPCVAEGIRQKAVFRPDTYREWRALLHEVRNIQSDSSVLTVVSKVCNFFLGEGNPIGLFVMTYFLNRNEHGIPAYLHLFINCFWSLVIALYLTREKRDVCRKKQNGRYIEFICDTFQKFWSLSIDWINEISREEKRRNKVASIEDNIYRPDDGCWYLKKNGCTEMTKFFSSHVRYLREDILIATLRSFSLVMYFAMKMTDSTRKTLTLCTFADTFKLLFMVWTCFKISISIKSFHDAKKMYYSTVQLWASTWRSSSVDSVGEKLKMETENYYEFQSFQNDYKRSVHYLDLCIHFTVIASRYLQAIVLIVSIVADSPFRGLLFAFMYCIAITIFNMFMLDLSYCKVRNRARFLNPPSGFSKSSLVGIERFMGVLFFDYAYTKSDHAGKLFSFRAIFVVPSSIVFYGILLISNGQFLIEARHDNMHSMHTTISSMSLGNISFPDRCITASPSNFSSRNTTSNMDYWNNGYWYEPVDVFSYLGGINIVAIITIVCGLVASVLEVGYKALLRLRSKHVDLQKFEGFPYLDAIDFYRTLIRNIVNKGENILEDNPNSHNQNIEMELLNVPPTHKTIDSLRGLMMLTLIDDEHFRTYYNQTLILNQYEHWDLGLPVPVCEIEALLQKFRNNDHPLEALVNNIEESSDTNLLTKMFQTIQQSTDEKVRKDQDLKLFNKFCLILDLRLYCMTSYRMVRTFDLLKQTVSKTYE